MALTIVGDVGGTKTELALVDILDQPFNSYRDHLKKSRWLNHGYFDFKQILGEFLQVYPQAHQAEFLCLGVAGMVSNASVRMTHLNWKFEPDSFSRLLPKLKQVFFLNDVEAQGYGLCCDPSLALRPLKPELKGDQKTHASILSLGTGLGEGFIIYTDGQRIPIASEGGHAGFIPFDHEDIALWKFIYRKQAPIRVEQALSGCFGFKNLTEFYDHLFLESERNILASLNPHDSLAATILELASQGSEAANKIIAHFIKILAHEARCLTLKLNAWSGVYLTGGLSRYLNPWIDSDTFYDYFCQNMSYQDKLGNVPVYVVLDENIALKGALYFVVHQRAL